MRLKFILNYKKRRITQVIIILMVSILLSSCNKVHPSNFNERFALEKLMEKNTSDSEKINLKFFQHMQISGYFSSSKPLSRYFYYVPHGQHIKHELNIKKAYIVFQIDNVLKEILGFVVTLEPFVVDNIYDVKFEVLKVFKYSPTYLKEPLESTFYIKFKNQLHKDLPLYITHYSEWKFLTSFEKEKDMPILPPSPSEFKNNLKTLKNSDEFAQIIYNGKNYFVDFDLKYLLPR